MFQAKIRHPADDEAEQILVGKQGWRQDGGEDVHGGAPLGVRHQRQVDELLDRATPDLAPDALVFALDLLSRWMRGPSDTEVPEIVETCLDGAVAAAEGREELLPQPGDGGEVHEPPGAVGQHQESLFSCGECTGQELALGALKLQREGECSASLPAVLRQQRATGGEVSQRRIVGR